MDNLYDEMTKEITKIYEQSQTFEYALGNQIIYPSLERNSSHVIAKKLDEYFKSKEHYLKATPNKEPKRTSSVSNNVISVGMKRREATISNQILMKYIMKTNEITRMHKERGDDLPPIGDVTVNVPNHLNQRRSMTRPYLLSQRSNKSIISVWSYNDSYYKYEEMKPEKNHQMQEYMKIDNRRLVNLFKETKKKISLRKAIQNNIKRGMYCFHHS